MGDSGVKYSGFAIFLHWLVALLVLTLVAMGIFMSDIPKGDPDRAFFFNLHKSIGLTTGIVVLIRLWWRHKSPAPPLPGSVPAWQVRASKISHGLLYLCLLAMPIIGFAASQYTKYGVTYFGLFKIPPLAAENPATRDLLQEIHHELAYVLILLVVVHVLAALYHHFVKKDGVIQRIMP